MKKPLKIVSSIVFTSTLLIGGSLIASADGGEYDTTGTISFTPYTGITDPIDPDNPDEKVEPKNPDGTDPIPGTTGPLSIDFASSFDFGEQAITSEDQTYFATPQTILIDGIEEERANYVQVSDNRGLETGWTLQVRQEEQFKTEEAEELTGAAILISNVNVQTSSASSLPSTVSSEIDLTAGVLSDVMSAEAGEGAGTYVARFGDAGDENISTSVSLTVPGSTTKYAKEYSTNLTWVLTDAPGNS